MCQIYWRSIFIFSNDSVITKWLPKGYNQAQQIEAVRHIVYDWFLWVGMKSEVWDCKPCGPYLHLFYRQFYCVIWKWHIKLKSLYILIQIHRYLEISKGNLGKVRLFKR